MTLVFRLNVFRNVYILKFFAKISSFIRSENTKSESQNGPDMNNMVMAFIVFRKLMDLCMTVVTTCYNIGRSGVFNLGVFDFTVGQTFFFVTGLEETTTSATAEVVRFVWIHVDNIFFADSSFYNKSQVVRRCIAKSFSDDLARILNSEFDFKVFIPVGIGFDFAFTDPLSIQIIDVINVAFVFDVELFQSYQD